MAEASLVTQITDWLVDQSLGEPDIVELFDGVCHAALRHRHADRRAHADVVDAAPAVPGRERAVEARPAGRARPVPPSGQRVAEPGCGAPCASCSSAASRCSAAGLTGPGQAARFRDPGGPREARATPTTSIIGDRALRRAPSIPTSARRGIFVTWASDRPSGFTDDDLDALQRIQRRLAIACKTVIQARIARNITEAYLGTPDRASACSTGSIRLGDGEQTRALVWYSDLRNSTRLAETMPSADFLELLNVYFECAARPAIAAGGEVLAFVGDAVLAIFPVERRFRAAGADAPRLSALAPVARSSPTASTPSGSRRPDWSRSATGSALNIGPVMYGNIGVPERLAFSAIGPTVIEVARIEKLTKTVGVARARHPRGRRVRAASLALDRRASPRGPRPAAGAVRVPRGSGAAGGLSGVSDGVPLRGSAGLRRLRAGQRSRASTRRCPTTGRSASPTW